MLSVLPLFLKNFFLSGGKGNICRPRTFFPPSAPFNIIIKNRAALKNDGAHPPGRGRAAARRSRRYGKNGTFALLLRFCRAFRPEKQRARRRTPQAPLRKNGTFAPILLFCLAFRPKERRGAPRAACAAEPHFPAGRAARLKSGAPLCLPDQFPCPATITEAPARFPAKETPRRRPQTGAAPSDF